MNPPLWVRKVLNLRGVPYEELRHPGAFTAQGLAAQEHFSGHRVAKVVVVLVDGRLVELVLPASRRVALEKVRELLGARGVRLASEEEMDRAFAGCQGGAIPPLRHWPDVEVLMDSSMRVEGDILFQAGTHQDAVRLNFDDWEQMVRPRVGSFSAPAAPAAG